LVTDPDLQPKLAEILGQFPLRTREHSRYLSG
jgi:hypothetical protein